MALHAVTEIEIDVLKYVQLFFYIKEDFNFMSVKSANCSVTLLYAKAFFSESECSQ